ncbi:MAG: hypothetical protein NTV34_00340, partial [Proteobacteria bacterium]|nr:hypothetical protein [Pseudomonadota bacterium]
MMTEDEKQNDKIEVEPADGDAGEAMESILGRIWESARKLHGIGELIKFLGSEPSLNQSEVNYGVGTI